MRYISYKKSWHKYKVVLIYKYTTVEILKKQMIFLGGDTMDEEILVILIAYVIMPIIICTICLIVEIIRNNKRNGEKDFVDEVGEFDLGSLAWLAYVMIFLAIVKLIIKW